MRAAFETSYRRQFSRFCPASPIKHRLAARGGDRPAARISISRALAPPRRRALDEARAGTRPVWFAGGWVETPIWSRLDLPVGAIVAGPAVLEQPDATTLCRSRPSRARRRARQSHHREERRDERASTIALLLCDLQNDFVHPNGAYGRAGQASAEIAALPARLAPLADLVRASGGWIVSTHFTLVPGRGGEPMISPHLKELRPFLAQGRFPAGRLGPRAGRRARASGFPGRENRLFRLLHDAARVGVAQGGHRAALCRRHRHQRRRRLDRARRACARFRRRSCSPTAAQRSTERCTRPRSSAAARGARSRRSRTAIAEIGGMSRAAAEASSSRPAPTSW